jgi:hypothetical protein
MHVQSRTKHRWPKQNKRLSFNIQSILPIVWLKCNMSPRSRVPPATLLQPWWNFCGHRGPIVGCVGLSYHLDASLDSYVGRAEGRALAARRSTIVVPRPQTVAHSVHWLAHRNNSPARADWLSPFGTEQNRTEQNRTEQNRTEQNRLGLCVLARDEADVPKFGHEFLDQDYGGKSCLRI